MSLFDLSAGEIEELKKRSRPLISEEVAKRVLADLFGVSPSRLERIDSYDDCNFFVYLPNSSSPNFVLKFQNAADPPCLLRLQWRVEEALRRGGIRTMTTVASRRGRRVEAHPLAMAEGEAERRPFLVRLQTVVDGIVLVKSPLFSPQSSSSSEEEQKERERAFRELGAFLGKVDATLFEAFGSEKGFGWQRSREEEAKERDEEEEGEEKSEEERKGEEEVEAMKRVARRQTAWNVLFGEAAAEYLHCVPKDSRREIAARVFEGLRELLRRERDEEELRKSIIWNDANEQNILVDLPPPSSSPSKEEGSFPYSRDRFGAIDFGDVCLSFLCSDAASSLGYLLMQLAEDETDCHFLACARSFLEGFESELPLRQREKEAFLSLLLARVAVSAVFSAFSFSLQPDNTYLLTTGEPGWRLLERVTRIGEEKVKKSIFS